RGDNAELQVLATLDLADTGVVGVRPAQGTFSIVNARLLSPRDPYRSVLFYRMATLGPGRMPRIGSTVVDETGVALVHDWIAHLPGSGIVPDPSSRAVARTSVAVKELAAARSASATEVQSKLDPLLASTCSALQ